MSLPRNYVNGLTLCAGTVLSTHVQVKCANDPIAFCWNSQTNDDLPVGDRNMKISIALRNFAATLLIAATCVACALRPAVEVPPEVEVPPDVEVASGFIVQAETADAAAAAVRDVGGVVTHELAIIQAVGAYLDSSQLAELRRKRSVTRVYEDVAVTTSSSCALWPDPRLSKTARCTGASRTAVLRQLRSVLFR